MSTLHAAKATVVIVPRERFSYAAASLKSILHHTPPETPIIYVDGRMPATARSEIERVAAQRPLQMISTTTYVTPNRARNLGLHLVKTPYTVFIDNDVVVSAYWLEQLIATAESSGADIVSPLTFIDIAGRRSLHISTGDARLQGPLACRVLNEQHHNLRLAEADAARLPQAKTELVEFHALLVRTNLFDTLGPLDEKLLSVHEHVDLCLLAAQKQRLLLFEPAAAVTYVPAMRLSASDLAYFMLRWSEAWNAATVKHFNQKWELAADDVQNTAVLGFARFHRARGLRIVDHRQPKSQLARLRRNAIIRLESALNSALYPPRRAT